MPNRIEPRKNSIRSVRNETKPSRVEQLFCCFFRVYTRWWGWLHWMCACVCLPSMNCYCVCFDFLFVIHEVQLHWWRAQRLVTEHNNTNTSVILIWWGNQKIRFVFFGVDFSIASIVFWLTQSIDFSGFFTTTTKSLAAAAWKCHCVYCFLYTRQHHHSRSNSINSTFVSFAVFSVVHVILNFFISICVCLVFTWQQCSSDDHWWHRNEKSLQFPKAKCKCTNRIWINFS